VVAALVVFIATRPSTKKATTQADAVAQGKRLYVSRCAICHGRQGDGSAMGPPMFSGELAALPDQAYRTAINKGVSNKRTRYGPMPPQQMSASDVTKVIAYIRSAQTGPG
jgi:mono/diheme cytochrome c family protein